MARCLAVGAAGAVVLACQPQETFHVLLGQLYEQSRDCVDPTASIDIADGPDPGLGCMPTCIVTPVGQNGGPSGVYVSTMCPPYPPQDDTSGSEPACSKALAALARGDVCAIGDGSAGPPVEGGEGGSDSAGE